MTNQFYKVVVFMFIVVGGTLMLAWIPETTVKFGKHSIEIKNVDMLADIRKQETTDSAETVAIVPQVKPPFADTCKTGVVCIEDYSEKQNSMNNFYDALIENKRPVRIAYFGDSFIEGDLLTCSLRDFFHDKYGGEGAGFVPINCITAGFRMTVVTYASGWGEHCVTDSIYTRANQGISGHYFYPNAGATATFACRTTYGKTADTCSTASFYFVTDGDLKFTTTINRKDKQKHEIKGDTAVQKITVSGNIAHVRITIDNPGKNTRFFGAALDNESQGIVIDNFSLRGTSGSTLKGIPDKILRAFDRLRHYDLIVFQYGLNVATKTGSNYAGYKKTMIDVVNHFRKSFPKSSILLVSVGDRAAKINGEMTTMTGVKNLCATQQSIAAECGIAFWNLIDAMALDGGIAGYVKSKPAKANLDYTHINIRGGEQIAKRLFEAIEFCKDRYVKKNKYNEE